MTKQNPFTTIAIEQVASYWNRRPCNIRHSPSEVGTRQYFDEVEARKYLIEPHIPGFAEFPRWQGKKVLEIGCGLGTDTMNFARAGARVTAVDLSSESLKLAKQRAEVLGLSDRITFYQANAEELSTVVPPQAYDLVYSFGVIHHTPAPERVIEQIRQHYLQPGSIVKIMVYHRNSYKVFRIVTSEGKGAFWNLDQLVAYSSEAQSGCPITYTYTRDSVGQLLAGLEIVNTQVDHIFPYRISDYVQYRYIKEWQFRYLPKPVFHWLEQQFGWHLCVTAQAV
jgi:2-polyprenyl-3-methyl-5-hydroxy-6-metoxy-1,4-benzoquinol methylase